MAERKKEMTTIISQEKIADVESGHIDPILVDSLNKTVVAYAGLISPIIQ